MSAVETVLYCVQLLARMLPVSRACCFASATPYQFRYCSPRTFSIQQGLSQSAHCCACLLEYFTVLVKSRLDSLVQHRRSNPQNIHLLYFAVNAEQAYLEILILDSTHYGHEASLHSTQMF